MTETIQRVWVVVADGEHARVVSPTVSAGQFATRQAVDSAQAHQQSSDLGSDRPGRVNESVGGARHAVAPRSDPHRKAKHEFAVAVAHQVNAEVAQGGIDRIVLVAPDHALRALRAALSLQAAELVVGELAKDLTKVPDGELGGHLRQWWAPPPRA